MKDLKAVPAWLWLLLLGAILFLPFLGSLPLLDWFEIYHAEISREMLNSRNYSVVRLNFEPVWEELPLFFWIQALSLKLFGVNEFAARLPNALIGIATLIIVYYIGRYLISKRFAWMWSLLLAATFLPHLYFRSAFDEPLFSLLIFLSVYFASVLSFENEFTDPGTNKRIRFIAVTLSALFAGLAALTDDPLAVMIILLSFFSFFFLNRGRLFFRIKETLLWLLICVSISSAWYGWIMYENELLTLRQLLAYHIDLFAPGSDLLGKTYMQLAVLLLGSFPAIPFIFDAVKRASKSRNEYVHFKNMMYSLLLSTVAIILITKTATTDYSAVTFIPFSFLAAYFLYGLLSGDLNWKWYHSVLLGFISIAWIFILIILPLDHEITGMNLMKTTGFSNFLPAVVFSLGTLVTAFFIWRKKWRNVVFCLIVNGLLLPQLSWQFLMPDIINTQVPMIEFIQSRKEEDCIMVNTIPDSYAHLYYAELDSTQTSLTVTEAENVATDRKVYLIERSKVDLNNDKWEKLYSKGDYTFYERIY